MYARNSIVNHFVANRLGLLNRRSGLVFALVGGVAMFLGLASVLRNQQRQVVSSAALNAQFLPGGELRPIAEVRDAVRSMKLVTTEVTGQVSKTVADERWRGNAVATVEAPVVYHYGVDLSRLDTADVRLERVLKSYRIRIPPPERIASELDMDKRSESVTVTGTRFRSRAGEFVLGLARVGIHSAARDALLPPEQMQRICAETLERVKEFVQKIVGPDMGVEVEFAETPRPS